MLWSDGLDQCTGFSSFQIAFVPRDTEEYEFFDSVDFGGVAFRVETVKYTRIHVDIDITSS